MQSYTSSGAGGNAIRSAFRRAHPQTRLFFASSRLSSHLAAGSRTEVGLNPRCRLNNTSPTTDLSFTCRHASSASAPSSLRTTRLHPLHVSSGAKLTPFAGFSMPVQYADLSITQSHTFTREHASLFDVGHMVQRLFHGPGAEAFLQRVTPSGLAELSPHRSTLSCLMKEDGSGGVVDDTVITRLPEGKGHLQVAGEGGLFYVVTNAGCREKDDAYFARETGKWNAEKGHESLQVAHKKLDDAGLVALQGPESAEVLGKALIEEGASSLQALLFGQSLFARVRLLDGQASGWVHVARGGYTGEDGFEVSMEGQDTVRVTEAVLANGGPDKVRLAGLGARDSLRLEAGMCLYGHDLNEDVTPVEAGLSWIIPQTRRTPDAGYYGAELLARQFMPKNKGGVGVTRRRIGLVVEGSPAREEAEIVSLTDGVEPIGRVTSGCPSPTLKKNIAMAYVRDGFHKAGTEVGVVVRGKTRRAVVTKMPFVATRYYKGTGTAPA